MYDGTLYGHWQAIVAFQQFIVLCDADGVVDMTPQAIAARTSIPLEILIEGIRILEQPDPYTRTPGEDGKRITLLDTHRPWGWQIVNHKHYQYLVDAETIRAQNRERQRKHREKVVTVSHAPSRSVTPVTESNAPSLHTDTDTDSDKIGQSDFDRFWFAYPKKVKRKTSAEIWNRKRLDSKTGELIADIQRRVESDRRWREGFIPDPTTYLNQERWGDELEVVKRPRVEGL